MTAQRLLRGVGNVLAVNEDAPLLDIGQAQQKLGERCFARAAHTHQANSLTSGNMQLELIKHLRSRIAVGVVEVDVHKIDGALLHLQVRCTWLVGHQTRLVEDGRHAACVAESAVKALKPVVDEVELVGDGVGVGEHNHQRTGRDAVPRVAARNEHRHHRHDHHRDACRDNAAGKRCPHALRVALHHFPVRVVEQAPLVIFTAVGLHRKDVGNRIGQLSRKLVLRAGGLLVQRENALVEIIRDAGIQGQKRHQYRNIQGDARQQYAASENHRADNRQKREHDGLN